MTAKISFVVRNGSPDLYGQPDAWNDEQAIFDGHTFTTWVGDSLGPPLGHILWPNVIAKLQDGAVWVTGPFEETTGWPVGFNPAINLGYGYNAGTGTYEYYDGTYSLTYTVSGTVSISGGPEEAVSASVGYEIKLLKSSSDGTSNLPPNYAFSEPFPDAIRVEDSVAKNARITIFGTTPDTILPSKTEFPHILGFTYKGASCDKEILYTIEAGDIASKGGLLQVQFETFNLRQIEQAISGNISYSHITHDDRLAVDLMVGDHVLAWNTVDSLGNYPPGWGTVGYDPNGSIIAYGVDRYRMTSSNTYYEYTMPEIVAEQLSHRNDDLLFQSTYVPGYGDTTTIIFSILPYAHIPGVSDVHGDPIPIDITGPLKLRFRMIRSNRKTWRQFSGANGLITSMSVYGGTYLEGLSGAGGGLDHPDGWIATNQRQDPSRLNEPWYPGGDWDDTGYDMRGGIFPDANNVPFAYVAELHGALGGLEYGSWVHVTFLATGTPVWCKVVDIGSGGGNGADLDMWWESAARFPIMQSGMENIRVLVPENPLDSDPTLPDEYGNTVAGTWINNDPGTLIVYGIYYKEGFGNTGWQIGAVGGVTRK
jgi:hypothetical protein